MLKAVEWSEASSIANPQAPISWIGQILSALMYGIVPYEPDWLLSPLRVSLRYNPGLSLLTMLSFALFIYWGVGTTHRGHTQRTVFGSSLLLPCGSSDCEP